MRWVVYALITAEELGITKANVGDWLDKANKQTELTRLRRFLGVDGDLGMKLGLEADFVVKTIAATGNYGEIYNRHLGPNSAVPIPRGINQLYRDGGAMTAPPFQ